MTCHRKIVITLQNIKKVIISFANFYVYVFHHSSARHTIAMMILVSLLTLDFHCSEAYKLPLTRLRKRQRTLFRRDNDENPRTFEEPKCLSTIKTDGISIVNYGISYLNSSIEISGRFYEALKDLYNSDQQVMKTIVYETLEKYDKYDYSYYKHVFNDTLEEAIIGPYTYMLYESVNQLLRKHDCGKQSSLRLKSTPVHMWPTWWRY